MTSDGGAREADRVEVVAPAKLNLALLVGPVRPDGFHEIASLMLPVTLADRVTVERTPGAGLDVVCDVAPGADNLAAKVVRELEQRLDRSFEVRVTIDKRVPHGGGLGGGSSDAAATLVALERLFDLDLSSRVRYEVAAAVGCGRPLLPLAGRAARDGARAGAQGGAAAGPAPGGRRARPRPEHRRGVRLARRGRGGDAQGVRAAGAGCSRARSRRRRRPATSRRSSPTTSRRAWSRARRRCASSSSACARRERSPRP